MQFDHLVSEKVNRQRETGYLYSQFSGSYTNSDQSGSRALFMAQLARPVASEEKFLVGPIHRAFGSAQGDPK